MGVIAASAVANRSCGQISTYGSVFSMRDVLLATAPGNQNGPSEEYTMTAFPFSSTPARAARLIVVALALMLAVAAFTGRGYAAGRAGRRRHGHLCL